MEGMEEQHKILKRKLPAILDVIADAEKQSSHREGAKAWLEELKSVAYETNDIFDEFNYEALRRQAKKNGHTTKLGVLGAVKLFPTHNRVVFRYRMSDKLRRVVETIEVLVSEMNAFGFKYWEKAPASKQWRQTDSIIVDPDNIVTRSRIKEKQEIVQILYRQEQRRSSHSRSHIWNGALQTLKEKIEQKRYLLVLDDVWNKDANKWERLKACLQQGGIGSVVLTTTRDKGIAWLMGTTKARNIAALDNIFIKEIIEARAFGSQDRPAELVNMVDSIVQRCVGSPLAAKALGSVLHNKTTVKEWEAVAQASSVCNDENGILHILKLSYDDMPSGMKQCFAFCAVFPKDYEIDIGMLIKLWMANGFIPEQKGDHIEATGKRIFNEMVSRSFFQDVKEITFDYDKRAVGYYSITTCKIHDLMHDVALSVMERELVAINAESSSNIEFLPKTTRHLHFSCYEAETLPILNRSMKKMCLPIQTLMAGLYEVDDLQHLSKYSSLRVLQLRKCSSMLMRPKHLPHLRYLDLSESHIKALPQDISILYNLQTLNLSACKYLDRLPNQLKYMTALRHLYTHGCYRLKCMPPDLRLLTSLQTLTYFVVGSGSDCSNLGELKHLNIGGSLLLGKLENVKEQDVKAANLVNKKELRELSLSWTKKGPDRLHDHMVLEGLIKCSDALQALRIYSYRGTTFPMWMGMLQNIHELYLCNCNESRILPPLGNLKALEVLRLDRLKRLRCLCSGPTPFAFPNLKVLKLVDLMRLKIWCEGNWVNEKVIFPRLEKLTILRCEVLTALPVAPLLHQECDVEDNDMAHSVFPELKVLKLDELKRFHQWDAAEAQGRPVIFPHLEELSIYGCGELIALPVAPLLGGSYGQDNTVARSAFPALKVLKLKVLVSFCRWESVDITPRRQIIFPHLEKLSIWRCRDLRSLPVAPLLRGSCGQDNMMARSAFPALKVLKLKDLENFCEWEPVDITPGRHIIFPHLEQLSIRSCDHLKSLPEAPFLKESYPPDNTVARSVFPALKVPCY
ncbi:hypothetical protein QOZ80_1BG0065380 [Eleusine coracana subsp. coracana]|nr:hypothetical protein QOZ80_1BG0065380 [Eleusine coracana subsp. coracana]